MNFRLALVWKVSKDPSCMNETKINLFSDLPGFEIVSLRPRTLFCCQVFLFGTY